jgi:hypothetical protein
MSPGFAALPNDTVSFVDTRMTPRLAPRLRDAQALAVLAALPAVLLLEALTDPTQRVLGLDMNEYVYWETFIRATLARDELPHWNPYILSGVPSLADLQTAFLYPVNVVIRALGLNINSAFTWGIAFHIWLMGAGTYALCRQVGTGRLSALISAMGMMLGGAIGPRIYSGHVTVVYGFSWLPLALALAIRSFSRTSFMPSPLLVIVLAVQALTGSPQTIIYIVALVGAYALFTVAWPSHQLTSPAARYAPLAQVAVAGVLAMALGASQWLPTINLVLESGRGGGLAFSQTVKGSFYPQHLLTILFPNAFATPANDFQDGFGGGLWEKSLFVGVLVSVAAPLAFGSRAHRRSAVFFGVIALLSLASAFGEHLPFYRLHHMLLPSLRIPGRLVTLTALALAVLGAIGLDVFVRSRRWHAPEDRSVIHYLVAASGLVLILTITGVSGATGLPALYAGWMSGADFLRGLVAAVGLIGMAVLAWPLRKSTIALSLAAVITGFELFLFCQQFIAFGNPSPNLEAARAFAGLPVGRVLSVCQSALPSNSMIALRIPTVDGSSQAYLRDYANLTSLTLGERMVNAPTGAPNLGKPPVLDKTTFLDAMNVTHVHACQDLDRDLPLVAQENSSRVYERPGALDRAYWACQVDTRRSPDEVIDAVEAPSFDPRRAPVVLAGSETIGRLGSMSAPCTASAQVEVVSRDRADGGISLTVNAATPGYLAISEPYYPERQAWVDGQPAPLLRTNLAFSGLPIDAGSHRVELKIVPASFNTGVVVSISTLLLWAGLILVVHLRTRTHPRPAPASLHPEPAR